MRLVITSCVYSSGGWVLTLSLCLGNSLIDHYPALKIQELYSFIKLSRWLESIWREKLQKLCPEASFHFAYTFLLFFEGNLLLILPTSEKQTSFTLTVWNTTPCPLSDLITNTTSHRYPLWDPNITRASSFSLLPSVSLASVTGPHPNYLTLTLLNKSFSLDDASFAYWNIFRDVFAAEKTTKIRYSKLGTSNCS